MAENKTTKKIMKNRNRRISRLLNKWLVLFMCVFLILSSTIGVILAGRIVDRTTYNTLFGSIIEYMDVTTGYFYGILYQNLHSVEDKLSLEYDREKMSVNEFLERETKILNLVELLIVSPDGIIRYASDEQLVNRNVKDLTGKQKDLKKLFDPKTVDSYIMDCQVGEFSDTSKYYYVGTELSEDCFLGKEGWNFILSFRGESARNMLSTLGKEFCEASHIGENGINLLLDKTPNPDGSYTLLATLTGDSGYDVMREDESTQSVDIPLGDKIDYSQNALTRLLDMKVFSYTYENDDFYAMAFSYCDEIVVSLLPRSEANKLLMVSSLGIVILLFVVFLFLGFILNRMLTKGIVRPVRRLNKSVEQISSGNLDIRMDVTDNREFAMLSDDINIMVLTLKRYIQEAEGRIDRELALAKTIQHSAVPNIFPPYPDRTEFEIYASMETAKEVGGDFYDFFFIDDDHFAIVIADVSDKGIPAAMFMMQAKARIHGRTMMGGTPAQILSDVNNALCEDNEAKLFVTVWLAIIELSTGNMTEANGGHEHPALYTGKTYRLVRYPHSPPLAAIKDIPFFNRESKLNPGDRLFVYTDGVTDAVGPDEQRFGEEGLIHALTKIGETDTETTIRSVSSAIADHAAGAAQFDDITMCAFWYHGNHNTSEQ